MEHEKRVAQILENAKKQFAVNGVEWNDRVEAAVRNLITPFMSDLEHMTMPPDIVATCRDVLVFAIQNPTGHETEDDRIALGWLDRRYNGDGLPIED